MAENNAWDGNSRRGNSQPRAAGAREATPVEPVRSTGREGSAAPKEAKRKAGPSGQKEKQRKETKSSERTKSGSRRGGRRKAQKARLQPSQVQEPKTQREEGTTCVGVLHVSSRAEWTCHMVECAKPYHALRECDFFRSLSARERTRRVRNLRLCEGCLTYGHSTRARNCPFRKEDEGLCSVRKCGRGHHRLLHDGGGGGSIDSQDEEWEQEASCNSGMSVRNPVQ
jgi:hypothetical protein